MNLLVVAVVVLSIFVLALALTVFALARQIGVLYERVAPAGALMLNQTLKVNDIAPAMTVESLDGQSITIAGDLPEKATNRAQLLFFLAPDCPICKSLLPVVKSIAHRESKVQVVLASDGSTVEEHKIYVGDQNLSQYPYVLSEALGKSYGVSKLPYAVLIRANGTIGSLGIVNSREHLESLFEAESLGVASLQDYLAGPVVDENGSDISRDLFVDATAQKP